MSHPGIYCQYPGPRDSQYVERWILATSARMTEELRVLKRVVKIVAERGQLGQELTEIIG